VYAYRAQDPDTGRVEHEHDHVLLARVPADVVLDPDPAEVAALRWVTPEELRGALAAQPRSYAPWLAGVLDIAAGAASAETAPAGDRNAPR
jgi:isopentenyl-diphosphate Delta-isomerase